MKSFSLLGDKSSITMRTRIQYVNKLFFLNHCLGFYTIPSSGQECVQYNDALSGVFFTPGEFHQGCSPVTYCISLYNDPTDNSGPIETLITFGPGIGNGTVNNYQYLVPVDNEVNGWILNPIDGTFSNFVQVPVSGTDPNGVEVAQYCLDFYVDELYIMQGTIKTSFLAQTLGCEDIIIQNQGISPGGVNVIESNEVVTVSTLLADTRLRENMSNRIVNRGTILVDQDFTFVNNSKVYMDEGAKITVLDNAHLTFSDQTKVLGCFEMWNSIEVQPGGELTIKDLVQVRDGIQAINALPNSTINVTNGTFKNNQVSIHSADGTGIDWTVVDNTFSSDALLSPFEGQIAKAGIEVRGVGANSLFGLVHFDNNNFDNMANGILARNSGLLVTNGSFEDMLSVPYHFPRGNGIHFQGGTNADILFQIGKGKSLTNSTFDNCVNGIFVINGFTVATNNGMVNVERGIGTALCKNKSTTITNSIISASDEGINFLLNQPQVTSDISGNDIIINGDFQSSSGIRINEFPIGIGYDIEDNRIEIQNAQFGIEVTGTSRSNFKNNYIRIENEAANVFGINVDASELVDANCNRVEKTTTDIDEDQYGIRFTNTPMSAIECNDFENVRYGINISGVNDATYLQGNSFERYYHGILMEESGNLPAHFHNANQWLGAFNSQTPGVFHEANTAAGGLVYFEADSGENPNFVPSLTPDWFENEPNQTGMPTYACPANCPDLDIDEWIPNQLDELIVIGDGGPITVTPYAEEQLWNARHHLYRRIRNNPQVAILNPIFNDFMNDLPVGIPLIEEGMEDVENIFLANDVPQALVETIEDKVNEISLSMTAGNSAQSSSVQSLVSELSTHYYTLKGLTDDMNQNLNDELDNIQSTLDFTTDETYEENARVLRAIFLTTFNADSEEIFTNEQRTQLEFIAYQCPLSGGDAVYIARGMLEFPNNHFPDDVLCTNAQNSMTAPLNQTTPIVAFSVYPNPATDAMTVQFKDALETNGEISIINQLGQVVQTFSVNEGTTQQILTVGEIPTGLYFLQVKEGAEIIETTTIQITK